MTAAVLMLLIASLILSQNVSSFSPAIRILAVDVIMICVPAYAAFRSANTSSFTERTASTC
jgi:hypothetical protein